MKTKLKDNRGISLVVVLIVMVVLLSVVGAALLFSGINTKVTMNYQTGTRAFNAADTGINAGISQLTLDQTTATAAFSKDMGGGLHYRSGKRSDASPQPLQYKGIRTQAGYSLGSGTGYNASGHVFYDYQMNVTGTYKTGWGTELAGREIEAQATYGPVAK